MKQIFWLMASILCILSCGNKTRGQSLDSTQKTKQKMEDLTENKQLKQITFGGGCFWCIEGAFNRLKGVESAISGYAGGHTENPNYKEVSTGNTGHAEVVQVNYDPTQISYEQLMEVFFFLHDPTQLNRQGNDVGTQYRSIVFYSTPEEKIAAEKALKTSEASGKWPGKYVTEIVPFEKFYPAEDYHQGYYNENPNQPYCTVVVGPKIQKFTEYFGKKGLIKEN